MEKSTLQQILLAAPEYYHYYISLVPDGNVLEYLAKQEKEFTAFILSLPADKISFRYAPGKWTPREVIGHALDTERIFAYRAMCIARGESQSLPGFEEDDYVRNGNFENRSAHSLANEFSLLRRSNIELLSSFGDEEWKREGLANNYRISVAAIVFMMAGHVRHHWNVIQERYLGVGNL